MKYLGLLFAIIGILMIISAAIASNIMYANLKKENQEFKKQVEEKQNPLKGIFAQVNDDTLLRDCGNMNAEINELKNQQKEFIEYLENEIYSYELIKDCLFSNNKKLKILKEILSKYKEIIGVSNDY